MWFLLKQDILDKSSIISEFSQNLMNLLQNGLMYISLVAMDHEKKIVVQR